MTELSAGIERIFWAHKDDLQRSLRTVEAAVAAIAAGGLDEDLRARAEADAHKLAGSLGTFGLLRGSDLARELLQRLARGSVLPAGDAASLAGSVVALRTELDAECARLANAPRATSPALAPPATTDHDLQPPRRRDPRGERLENGLPRAHPPGVTSGRILVVDDDPAVRDVLVGMLCEAGYHTRGVGSAREARYALEHETVALLLSDVSMPGETGLDLIRFALSEHPETATLLISALENPGIAQVAMDFGAYGYLSKPVRRSAVLIGVMNALRRRDVEAREQATRLHLEDILRLRTSALTEALERVEGGAAQAEALHRWAQSAEYRDPNISRHLKRVAHYCAALGEKFGLHGESLELASVLHDVGKIAIPDAIMLKAGPLTAQERLAVQAHATVGHEMLCDSSSGLLDLAALIAKTHHEKFDGSGYPCGLSGTEIPLEGRITAVADVFDALTSDRVYRTAWSLETTVAWMSHERGKHFDPDVLDAFFSSMDEIRSVQSLMSH